MRCHKAFFRTPLDKRGTDCNVSPADPCRVITSITKPRSLGPQVLLAEVVLFVLVYTLLCEEGLGEWVEFTNPPCLVLKAKAPSVPTLWYFNLWFLLLFLRMVSKLHGTVCPRLYMHSPEKYADYGPLHYVVFITQHSVHRIVL